MLCNQALTEGLNRFPCQQASKGNAPSCRRTEFQHILVTRTEGAKRIDVGFNDGQIALKQFSGCAQPDQRQHLHCQLCCLPL